MAASSPALGNYSINTPPKTLRGLNKPKCIQCGNVARSRCPYQSCKSCCSKAENPCPIHVLKANATFPDKAPASTSPLFDQQSVEASSAGNAHRAASLRQLSSNFAQFNNLQIPLRSRKPLTKKDATAINEWRFAKLKEYNDRNIEIENEAFDRYMQNISLLEEVFAVKSGSEGSPEDGSPLPDPSTAEDNNGKMILGLKFGLKSDTRRSENSRKRIKQIVHQGLIKLREHVADDVVNGTNDQIEADEKPKMFRLGRAEHFSNLREVIDKLDKARNNEDLKVCLEMKSDMYNEPVESSQTETKVDAEVSKSKSGIGGLRRDAKLFRSLEVDEETLKRVDTHFSSIEEIEDL